jgi:hypothetical protein
VNDLTRLSLPDRFCSLVEGLMNDVHADVVWGWTAIPLIKLLWRRLRRMKARFASIMARFEAGTLPAPGSARRPPAPDRPSHGSHPAAGQRGPRSPELPRRYGWVSMTIDRAFLRSWDLEEILDDPDTAATVAEAPQLGSVLRPACRMLGVKPPPWLRLPRRPRPPVEKFPPAPDWLVKEPGAELRSDGSVWMRLGASTIWRPGSGQTLEEARKFDRPRRIWPR